MIKPKLEYAEVIWSPHKKKYVLKLERMQRISTILFKIRLKEMHITTLKERRERGNLITIHKLIDNVEETNRKDLILRRKGEVRNLS